MKLNEILDLIHAGYSRAEIEAMSSEEQAPAAQPAQAAPPQPVQAPAPAPAAAPTPSPSQPDFSSAIADAIRQAMAAQQPPAAPAQSQQPAPVTQPAQPAQPAQPTQQASPEDSAQRILSALGMAAQGFAIPKEETLEDRMAQSLRVALGIPEEKKKED